MITHLKLENFKIWQSTGPLRLAPLTMLLGVNSAGKSSLVQAIQLIRQTVLSEDTSSDLVFDDPDVLGGVSIGSFEEVFCRHASGKELGLEFKWGNNTNDDRQVMFTASYGPGKHGSAALRSVRFGLGPKSVFVKSNHRSECVVYDGDSSKIYKRGKKFKPLKSYAFSEEAVSELGELGILAKLAGDEIRAQLELITHLPALRPPPKRLYRWNGQKPRNIGQGCHRLFENLIASGIVQARGITTTTSSESELAKLIHRAGSWLKSMGVADGIEVARLGKSSHYEIRIRQENESINVADVGTGVSQVLPVILACLTAAQGQVLVIEEPESHLHPSAQTVLADLFRETALDRKVQVIVETHSEHFLNRLQRRVAEDKLQDSDVAIYFCSKNGRLAKIEALRLNALGEIDNWPENFFGDEMEDLTARAIAASARLKGAGL